MSANDDTWLEEWKRARDVIEKWDERIHDVRKLGFAFLSSILTAETLFFHKSPTPIGAGAGFALLLVALATLFALRIFERQGQLVQSAAASRARCIELLRPVELTDVLCDRSRRDAWQSYTTGLYALFGVVAIVTAWVVTRPAAWTVAGIVAGGLYVTALAFLQSIDIELPEVDLSFDRVSCVVDEVVTIVAMNLGEAVQRMPIIQIWKAFDSAATRPVEQLQFPVRSAGFDDDRLRPLQSCTWQWKAPETPAVYVVAISSVRGPKSFRRSIRVNPKPTPPAPIKCCCCGKLAPGGPVDGQ